MKNENKKLKPVIFLSSRYPGGSRHNNNSFQQTMLLKALTVTQDPNKLRQMIGVKTVAEVYRTLDKLALRKEFHTALSNLGVDFEFIVGGIKDIAVNAFKDADKLNAYKALLKSLGMDQYDEQGSAGAGSWEDTLMKALEKEKEGVSESMGSEYAEDYYEVKRPVMPESAKKLADDEKMISDSIYG